MSTLAPPKPPPVSPPQHASPDVAAPPAAPERDSAIARLAAFAALAGFGVLHWSALVEDAPAGRMLLVVLVATACAAALTLVARLLERVPRPALYALAAALGLVALALGLLAAGLEARLLLPKHWGELADGLDRGLGGIQGVDWPYDGADAWIHQTILLGAPLLLVVAATIAFWPARRRAAVAILRAAGLIVLLVFYGSAVTEHDPGEPLLRGLVLLVLVAAWLWLPRVPVREAALGAAAVATVGVVALPLAAALDGGRPWWDYRGWNLFGGGKVVTFRWTHQYGPLDWPRDGTTLLNVKSQRALFWKAESLDTFDGVRWSRSNSSDATNALQGLPSARGPEGPTWEYGEWNPRWNRELRFTVRSLSTDLVVGAGTTYFVRGVGLYSSGSDGTIRLASDRLGEGDSYTVGAYVPTPTAKQMRASPDGLSAVLLPFTTIEVPQPSGFEPGRRREVKVPLWGGGAVGDTAFGDPDAPARALSGSVYSRMYGDATRVTAGASSMYDAVKQVRDYLNEEFSYSEKPRRARYPLNAFMFRDGFGYCQQFSGAMALMLRMVGIPARVAAGFAPGSYNRDTEEYRVRDLDAHSWVEVYFNGIGWVTFDPTPAAAPAELQPADRAGTSASPLNVRGDNAGLARPDRVSGGAGSTSADEGSGLSVPLVLLLALLVAGSLALVPAALRRRRVSRLTPGELADAQLSELRRALERLGWELPASTTLLGLERRLGRFAGPASEAYAGGLRAHRYDPRAPAAPSLSARRGLRRELSRGSLGERVKGLLAIPPAGPRV